MEGITPDIPLRAMVGDETNSPEPRRAPIVNTVGSSGVQRMYSTYCIPGISGPTEFVLCKISGEHQ